MPWLLLNLDRSSVSALLTRFPDQQPSLLLPPSSSVHFSVVILQCLMDTASLICKSCLCLVSRETAKSHREPSTQLIFIGSHWSLTQLPLFVLLGVVSPAQDSLTPARGKHTYLPWLLLVGPELSVVLLSPGDPVHKCRPILSLSLFRRFGL